MRKNKIDKVVRMVFVFSVFAFCFSVNAQTEVTDTLDSRKVMVEREFMPVIQDVGKILSTPVVMQASVRKKAANYLSMQLPMDIENAFQAQSAKLQQALSPNYSPLFLDLAYGNYYTSFANLAIPIVQRSKTELGFSALHNASLGHRKFSDTNSKLWFAQDFKTFKLSASAGFEHQYWNYYGHSYSFLVDTLASLPGDLNQRSYSGNMSFNTKTSSYDRMSLSASLDFVHTALSNSLSENRFNFISDLNFGFKKNIDRPYGVELQAELSSYNQDFDILTDTVSSKLHLGLSPYWKFETNKLKMKLGFNFQLATNDSTQLYLSPNLRVDYHPFQQFASFYAGVDGGVESLGLNEIFYLNPYVVDGLLIDDAYVPVRPYIGSYIYPVKGLQLTVAADYSYRKNDNFFVNRKSTVYDNRFEVIYTDVSSSSFTLDAVYSLKDLLSFKLNSNYTLWYNQQDFGQAWLKPAFVGDINAEYRLNPKLRLSAGLHYESVRYAKFDLITLPINSIVDIRLSAAYRINSHFGTYLKLTNLLNQHHQYIVGYDTQGLNVLLGGSYRL